MVPITRVRGADCHSGGRGHRTRQGRQEGPQSFFWGELPGSVRRQVILRELGQAEALFQQSDPALAIFEVASGRVRLVRHTIDDHLVAL